MTKLTNLCACIAILALLSSTFGMVHVVKPPPKPARLRKLQIDYNSGEPDPDTNRILASNSAHKSTENHHSQMDKSQESASGCGGSSGAGGIYGEGHGSGGTSLGFHNVFPFPSFPFGAFVPEVSTWGEGGGSGGSNTNPGMGVSCQCCNNGFPMHYVISPIHFQPMDSFSTNRMRKDGPNDMAPSPSAGN